MVNCVIDFSVLRVSWFQYPFVLNSTFYFPFHPVVHTAFFVVYFLLWFCIERQLSIFHEYTHCIYNIHSIHIYNIKVYSFCALEFQVAWNEIKGIFVNRLLYFHWLSCISSYWGSHVNGQTHLYESLNEMNSISFDETLEAQSLSSCTKID